MAVLLRLHRRHLPWLASLPATTTLVLALLVLLTIPCDSSEAYFANWGDIGRAQEPTCVDIPKNMSLCSNIQYKRMRLPNLLGHDTLTEVSHQSSSWVPLLNVGCHLDTQLFLCSLFTPVCLERAIYPCRSLCVMVQTACEKRMTNYGYHWPDMLRCDNFPEDNEMCLKALHTDGATPEQHQTESPDTSAGAVPGECAVCQPVPSYENILDHYCRADFVMRLRLKAVRGARVRSRSKVRVYKPAPPPAGSSDLSAVQWQRRALRKPRLELSEEASCCASSLSTDTRYLVMGKNTSHGLVPTFVLPWTKQKSLREAVRVFAGLDCSDPSLFTPDTQSGVILNTGAVGARRGQGGGRRKGSKKKKEDGETAPAGRGRGGRRGGKGRNREEGARRGPGGRARGEAGRRRGAGGRRGSEGDDRRAEKRERKNRRKVNREERNRVRATEQSDVGDDLMEQRKEFVRSRIAQSRVETNSLDVDGVKSPSSN